MHTFVIFIKIKHVSCVFCVILNVISDENVKKMVFWDFFYKKQKLLPFVRHGVQQDTEINWIAALCLEIKQKLPSPYFTGLTEQ